MNELPLFIQFEIKSYSIAVALKKRLFIYFQVFIKSFLFWATQYALCLVKITIILNIVFLIAIT